MIMDVDEIYSDEVDTEENSEENDGYESGSDESGSVRRKGHDDSAINQLATHLPDQVVFADHARSFPYQETLQGVLMFLDISGFTSLTEKYSMNKKNGTDQLTKTLNGYMRALVNEIITNDGDILKFAGDAILTLWQVDSFLNMKSTVAHVIKCALDIQEKCGTFATSVGVILKVKIGVSAGELMITFLGNTEFCHNVTMGRAVESVNAAEKFCDSGDIVISPSAWVFCAGLPLEVEIQDDAKHRKVFGFEAPHQQQYVMLRTLTVDLRLATTLNLNDQPVKPRKPSVGDPPPADPESKLPFTGSGFPSDMRVRKAVVETIIDAKKARMRLYIALPVLKKLDAGQPLEYLSEMRQVTIVFINLVTIEGTKYENTQTLQNAFKIIYANIREAQGCLNKVFMFDKGCTFLSIFGLPGFKHENDCARALQCAYKLKNEMTSVARVVRTSVGVTTGSSFCGVVGHEHRHEYTVIGRKVNMAARLMMAYGGKVTCDNETFHHSKLHKANFLQLEFRQMKGLQNIGTIREYKENKSRKGTIDALLTQDYEIPLIGREQQLETFIKELQTITTVSKSENQRQMIMITGEAGVGKSRLLDSLIVKAVKQDIRVVFCHLHMADAKSPYHAVTALLMELLEFEYDTPHHEREQWLFENFQDPFVLENLSMLNDLLHLKLPQSDKYAAMDSKTRGRMFHDLLFKIVHEMTLNIGYIIFAIDDAHFMDPESWEFVEELGHDNMSLVLCSLKPSSKYNKNQAAENVFKHSTTMKIPVSGLELKELSALACQLLGCISIPKQVDFILQQKSHGVPSWCEQLLYSMLYDGLLTVVPASSDTKGQQMVKPPTKYRIRKNKAAQQVPLKSKGSGLGSDAMLGSSGGGGGTVKQEDDMMCLLATEVTLADVRIPDSIKGMIQARIDRMEELEQMLIKTSAILGMSFSRRMLDTILPKKITQHMIQNCMSQISESNIFCCASLAAEQTNTGVAATTVASSARGSRFLCGCPEMGEGDEDISQRTINDCQELSFKSATLQETAYEMYTESLRRKLHMKAGRYLESQAHKCSFCGGGNFIPTLKVGPSPEVPPPTVGKGKKDDSKKKHHVAATTVSKMRKQSLRAGSSLTSEAGKKDSGARASMAKKRRESTVSSSGVPARGRAKSLKNKSINSINSITPVPLSTQVLNQEVVVTDTDSGDSKTPEIDKMLREKLTGAENEVPNLDLRECRCMQILLTVYPQLVRHWKAAGNTEKTIHFLIEASAAAIAIDENIQALAYLKEVEHILGCLKEGTNPFEGEVSHVEHYVYDSWEEARMESLVGQALCNIGQLNEAISHFHQTLKILGSTQPSSKFAVIFGIVREGFLQWRHHRFPIRYLGRSNSLLANRLIEQARCLSHVFQDYRGCQEHHRALLTVLQQVNKAEEVNSDLHELIIAYTCMMEYCQERNWPKLGSLYEYKAQVRCMMKKEMLAEDFMSMAHLQCTSLTMRLAWGRINDAIESGYTAHRIIKNLHDNDMMIQMLPMLAQALIMANRIKDAVEVLEELEYIDNETVATIGKAWYYACCMDLILETGVQLETYEKCCHFAQRHKSDRSFSTDKLPLFSLICSLTLWCQRKGKTDEVDKWKRIAKAVEPVRQYRSCMNVYSQLKLLEVDLIELARCKKRTRTDRIQVLTPHIVKQLNHLKSLCKRVPMCQPRLNHYTAYFAAQLTFLRKAQKDLKNIQAFCFKNGFEQERLWVMNSQQGWSSTRPEKKQDEFWSGMTYSKENIDWHARCENPVKFILPLPSWVD